MIGFFLLVPVFGCVSQLECGEGTVLFENACLVDTPPTAMYNALDAMAECVLADGDVPLDFESGCADGGCVDMSLDEFNTAYAEVGDCERWVVDTDIACTWTNGVQVLFPDRDADGTIDEGGVGYLVNLTASFEGTTPDGLGIGASMSCFVDVLGVPNTVSWRDAGDGDHQATFFSYGDFSVRDQLDATGEFDQDGFADWMTMH